MGANLCKSQAHFDNASQQQIPELSQKIQKDLREIKPCQQQLKNEKDIVIRKYHNGIYNGPVNMFDNPSGYGKFYYNNGSLYVGNFSNGKTSGQGTIFRQDGLFVSGDLSQNQIHKGTVNCDHYVYHGKFKQNLFHGKGQFRSKQHNYEFVGEFQKGLKKKGKLHWTSDHCIYTYYGSFDQNQLFDGQGQLEEQPIGIYKGTFKQGLKHGKGTYQYCNGLKYIGEYQNGLKSGNGKILNGDDNSEAYSGQFKDGLPHGKGKALGSNNTVVQANWIEGINQAQFTS